MTTIADALDVDADDADAAKQAVQAASGDSSGSSGTFGQDDIVRLLKSKTGDGQPDDDKYMEHPMNPMKRKEMGRFLRGAHGMFGDLNLAVVDMVVAPFEALYNFVDENGVPGFSKGGSGGESQNPAT